MIKAYYKRYTTTVNGVEYTEYFGMFLEEETKIIAKEIISGKWDNLDEIYNKFGLVLPFNVWNFKKGRVISFFNSSLFDKRTWDIKERKNPDFTFTIKVETIEKEDVSIQDILNYSNAEKAMQYLNERDIRISK